MLWLIAVASLLVAVVAALRYAVKRGIAKLKAECDDYQKKVYVAREEHAGLKQQVFDLQRVVDETAALFDLTRDVCAPLEKEKIFSLFRERISRFVTVDDCRLVRTEDEARNASGYEAVPLRIRQRTEGYLLLRGIGEHDRGTLDILTGQLSLGMQRALLYERVQELALTDGLTGAMNRRYFMERFEDEVRRSGELKRAVSFLMIDVDHFKAINDTFGHLVGDAALRAVAGIIKDSMRQMDFIGRYGGEELCVVLAETGKEQARPAAERIRRAVEAQVIRTYDEELRVTISIGAATFPDDSGQPQGLLEKADEALYRAKAAGRNKVEVC